MYSNECRFNSFSLALARIVENQPSLKERNLLKEKEALAPQSPNPVFSFALYFLFIIKDELTLVILNSSLEQNKNSQH